MGSFLASGSREAPEADAGAEITCGWSAAAPFADMALKGSCRSELNLTANFGFEPFGQLCTDNTTAKRIGGGLTLVLPLTDDDEPEDDQGEPLVDPAKRKLEEMKEEQRVA